MEGFHADVGVGADDAAANFRFEAVHHGKHDDQRRHADGDSSDGNIGNQGDEPGLTAGPQVALSDE